MTDYWPGFIRALGCKRDSTAVNDMFVALGDTPAISETPAIYDDPQGRTLFCKFIGSGLEFGFRAETLSHVHVFVQSHEGYSAYDADMLDQSAQALNRYEIIKHLGPAQDEAPGRSDALIGHTHGWARYAFDTYDLRMEFSDDGRLWKATLMDR
ncbi:hypothetical protein [Sphingomonas sp. NFX23]|uniref:hypothetical protein n=1 Tax=Sphingomonas sp. NFX23 TaxID=2819532 RepID=UPI003CEFD2FA